MFDRLWNDYKAITPVAEKIHSQFSEHGESVFNDHIAIRTFNHELLSIEKVAEPFIKMGYKCLGTYDFPEKKLKAKHYWDESNPDLPKVFISEIQTEKLPKSIQQLIDQHVFQKLSISTDLVFNKNTWGKAHYDVYQTLSDESEYLGWLYAHGICVNHFTVDTNKLHSFQSLEEVNTFLKSKGHKLNLVGGEIKGSQTEYLEQSSTISEERLYSFVEGEFMIPTCFYEFSRRYEIPGKNTLFQGFIAESANKIFESTNRLKAS